MRRKPRKIKMTYQEWVQVNAKAMMKVYIMTPTQTFFGTWLKEQYEEYLNGS